jgi:hypothetical protein
MRLKNGDPGGQCCQRLAILAVNVVNACLFLEDGE